MAEPYIIDVDGIPVEVDEESYSKNPDLIIDAVRLARDTAVGVLTDEPAPDYDDLVAAAEMSDAVPE